MNPSQVMEQYEMSIKKFAKAKLKEQERLVERNGLARTAFELGQKAVALVDNAGKMTRGDTMMLRLTPFFELNEIEAPVAIKEKQTSPDPDLEDKVTGYELVIQIGKNQIIPYARIKDPSEKDRIIKYYDESEPQSHAEQIEKDQEVINVLEALHAQIASE